MKTRAVYLAASYHRKNELRDYRKDLNLAGIRVTARWLDELNQNETFISAKQQRNYAEGDLVNILSADTVIVFTESAGSEWSRGGRHVELGYAIAMSKRVIVVGYLENIFCYLPQIEYCHTWRDALELVRSTP